MTRRRSTTVVAAIAAIAAPALTATSTHAQDAVQWRVEDGGNGHWYRIDSFKRDGSGGAAEAAGGDLACIETAAENEFLLMATPEDPDDDVEDFVAWMASFGIVRAVTGIGSQSGCCH